MSSYPRSQQDRFMKHRGVFYERRTFGFNRIALYFIIETIEEKVNGQAISRNSDAKLPSSYDLALFFLRYKYNPQLTPERKVEIIRAISETEPEIVSNKGYCKFLKKVLIIFRCSYLYI